jgi:hypothetical protein
MEKDAPHQGAVIMLALCKTVFSCPAHSLLCFAEANLFTTFVRCRVHAYVRCMFPDAEAPCESWAGPGGAGCGGAPVLGVEYTGLSKEQAIWQSICASVREAFQTMRCTASQSPAVSLDTLVDFLSRVVHHLRVVGALTQPDDPDRIADELPVILKCFGKPADWWYRALMLTLEGPWLPR